MIDLTTFNTCLAQPNARRYDNSQTSHSRLIPNPVLKSRFFVLARAGFVRVAPAFRLRVFIDLSQPDSV
jgi:hypothetical protein